jgi:hypothetical protein
MTTAKRLQALETIFIQRIETHVAAITPLFVARFNTDELRQVAALLRAVNGEAHDAAAAATGAALLAVWRGELSSEKWAAMWLLADVLQSVNAALASLHTTELSCGKR